MEFRFFALLLFFPFIVFSQGPRVPSRIEFADMKLRITDDARKEIQQDVDKLRRSPTYFDKQVEKAKSYFPIIERVFKEENLPQDFKYLVLQESGLISDAVSSSNAVGFWQFKDFTAMEVGLRVDRQVDERMNIVSASRGAARYLKKNNNTYFDNWLMSLQAYQMGPGTALKVGADKHRGEKSMVINKKTYWYVKKYLAHKIAYGDAVAGQGQIKLIEHRATPNESLSSIAQLYRVESEEVKNYNKWLRRGKIPGDRDYTVIVPTENYNMVALAPAENMPETTAEVLSKSSMQYDFANPELFPKIKDEKTADGGVIVEINGLSGILAKGNDKISTLAAKGELELSKFLKYNDLSIDDQLVAGQVYYLRSKRGRARAHYHVAQEGETLWNIAQKYGVKLKKLQTKNRMKPGEELKPGRVVWLRYIRPDKVPIEYREVQKKEVPISLPDSSQMIVKSEGVEPSQTSMGSDVSELVEENDIDRPLTFLEKLDSLESLEKHQTEERVNEEKENNIEVETTKIEVLNKTTQPPLAQDSVLHIHTVEAGETFYSISKQYNVTVMDVLDWNRLSIGDKLSIDQKVKIYRSSSEPENELEWYEMAQNRGATYMEYVVREGDTLYSIAKANNVKVEELLDWNEKVDSNIKLGEVLKIKKTTSD